MNPIRVGVVGVGRWGRNHVRVMKELEREGIVKLELVVDVCEDVCRRVASEFSVPRYSTDIGDVSRFCDAAVVAVPIENLYEVAKTLLEDGVHVLVEKPVSTSCSQIKDLITISESRGLISMPGFIMRFNPVVRSLRDSFDEGEVIYMMSKRLSRRPLQARRYSILLDLAVHDIDICLFVTRRRSLKLLNCIVEDLSDDELCIASIDAGGIRCLIHVDGLSLAKVREIDIIGRSFFMRGDTDSLVIYVRYGDGRWRSEKLVGEEPLKAEDRTFIRLVNGEHVDDAPTLRDALEVMKIIEDIAQRCSINLIKR